MHELGHVMGLGHVSSAVDGTRLMAGSIDLDIRRLPSALDLGEPSHQPPDSHLWDPYLAHYAPVSSADASRGIFAVNPASLVQAAHTPSHVGIFNQNFSNSDQRTTGGTSPARSRLPTVRLCSRKTATSSRRCPRPSRYRPARHTSASCWSMRIWFGRGLVWEPGQAPAPPEPVP